MICFEEKFMVMIDHPALINYNKTKLTEQWTSWDRQQVIVMVLMMMLKIDLSHAVYSLFYRKNASLFFHSFCMRCLRNEENILFNLSRIHPNK